MSEAKWLLTFNAGSSSLKFAVFEFRGGLRARLRGAVRDIGRHYAAFSVGETTEKATGIDSAADAAALVLGRMADGMDGLRLDPQTVVATGHRVVHGAEHFAKAVRIDAAAFAKLESLNHLAPLHNPHSLAVLKAVREAFPGVPAFAQFDTAFFHDLPESARAYAIPADVAQSYGIRRYGFHGLAHQYMAQQLSAFAGAKDFPERVISLHLGQGCSVAALKNGRPVDTSMGFTPLEGLVMGTRAGDIDAGILLHLAARGHDWRELEDLLNRKSGLLGLSGASDDVRQLLELEEQQHPRARLALTVFCHRITRYLGAYAAVLRGIDVIVIGGGIGENSPVIRARLCGALRWLGLELDDEANTARVGTGGRISTDGSTIDVHVIPVDEESIIANATWSLVTGENPASRRSRA
jgi:acetate kinase